jgi:hypothetical protein
MEWDKRISRRVRIRFDDPDKTPEENIRLAQGRSFWAKPPIVVEESEYLTVGEASGILRLRFAPLINLLLARGILQSCFVADGRQGVTRSSVEEEVEGRRTASRWQKFTRRAGGILHYL